MLKSALRLPPPRRPSGPLHRLWLLPTNLLGWAVCRALSGERGTPVGGPAARGVIYRVRQGIGLDWMGAVTLGHHILHRGGLFDGPRGRLILAHELAHTRQHDVLGPLYLPLHLLCQTVSLLLSLFKGPVRHSRVHDHNPLEETFIAIGAGATDAWPPEAPVAPHELLERFGV